MAAGPRVKLSVVHWGRKSQNFPKLPYDRSALAASMPFPEATSVLWGPHAATRGTHVCHKHRTRGRIGRTLSASFLSLFMAAKPLMRFSTSASMTLSPATPPSLNHSWFRICWAVARLVGSRTNICLTQSLAASLIFGQGSAWKSSGALRTIKLLVFRICCVCGCRQVAGGCRGLQG